MHSAEQCNCYTAYIIQEIQVVIMLHRYVLGASLSTIAIIIEGWAIRVIRLFRATDMTYNNLARHIVQEGCEMELL